MEVSEGTDKMEVFEAEVLPVSEEQVAESRNTRTSHSDHSSEQSEQGVPPTQSMQRLQQKKAKNLSFSTYEQKRIERENDRILRNLVDIQVRQPKFEPSANSSRPHHAAINRKKEEEKIKKENYQILNRLMNTKSTMRTRAPTPNTRKAPPRKPRENGGMREDEGPSFPQTPSLPSEPLQELVDTSKWETG